MFTYWHQYCLLWRQVSARCSTAVPRRQTLPASRHRSSMSSVCIPPRHRHWLSTVGDRAFPVAAPRIWNILPQHVMSAPSLAIFRSRLKTHLFRRCFPWLRRSLVVPEKWHVITDTLIIFYLLTYLLTSTLTHFSLYQNSMVISSVLDCESVWTLTVDILNTICNRDCFADCSLDLTLIVSFGKLHFWYVAESK